MVLVVENRNILVEIAAAELKVKQDACADTDTFDAGVEAFPVSEAQVMRIKRSWSVAPLSALTEAILLLLLCSLRLRNLS